MRLEDVMKSGPPRKKRKRVGRGIGSGSGKTSGRGTKGHGARQTFHGKLGHEGGQMPLFRRLPKRGFSNARYRVDYSVINVGDLAASFSAGEEVSLLVLRERGLIRSGPPRLKVLGGGELAVALKIKASAASASAVAKVEAAGGAVEIVS
ncbi:MAG: 50S ribosomal protein L15 [Planctomycetes bacterium]|nr:50S ribosomal protein L15 [Planctomycetota bacterium]